MTDIAGFLPEPPKPHRVAVAVFEGVVPFDFAIPCEVFERVELEEGRAAYEVVLCGVTPEIDLGLFSLRAPHDLTTLEQADTVILPGISDLDREVPPALIRAIREAADRGARIASICTGAFVLAATGLLVDRRATTHWRAAAELARRFPAIRVDPDVLYVDNGRLLTSAGAAAGLDLCLHMVRRDHGAAVAAATARLSVMPLERSGGQAQFIHHEPPAPDGSSLQPLLTFIEENLDQDLGTRALASRAATSTRTLHRRFAEQLGTTPKRWVLQARIRRARELLETAESSVEQVATATGFGSTASFRDQFKKLVGNSPSAYRRSFRAAE